MSDIPSMRAVLEAQIADLGTDADLKRGFCDVVVSTRAGEQHIVRLTVIPGFREKLIQRMASVNASREFLPAMLERKFATDDFLDSLTTQDQMKLGHRAMALLIGPEKLKAFLRQRLGLSRPNRS
jgi:hypothetical protein